MIGFSLPGFEISWPDHIIIGAFSSDRYPNGELTLALGTEVEGQECVIAASINSDEQLLTLMLLADTLKRQGARTIIVWLPFLPYARQDEAVRGRSHGMAWLCQLLQCSGIAKIITVDLHSPKAARACVVPIQSLSPVKHFVACMEKLGFKAGPVTVVAPDDGARERAQVFAELAKLPPPLVMHKERGPQGVKHSPISAPLSKQVVVVDDVLDSGATLVSGCRQLKQQGAQDIYIVVTHGQFSGTGWQELWKLGVTHLFVSDSLPLPPSLQADPRVHVCPLTPLLHQAL